ncbi:MAG: glyoxalase/bleomycin resistance protein/dioxygenase [Rhodocyclaceae bacterium]|nr:glyoxalase/bleomycin resistance protein/dioxygenase [Rhodocyclaceae bacterium]
MKVVTHLVFPGNCQAALQFYESVLGARIRQLFPYRGSPMESMVPAQMKDKVLHAVLEIGDNILMATDRVGRTGSDGMSGFAITLGVDTPAEAERLLAALAAGGEITMPLQETFWARRFGMLVDRFGVPWMINCDKAA